MPWVWSRPTRPWRKRRPVPVILTHEQAPEAKRAALATVADVVTAGTDRVDLAEALRHLHQRGLRHVLCEGGPQLLGTLAAADLIDEVCLTVSPHVAGGNASRIVSGPPTPLRRLTLTHVLTADGFLFLRYRRMSGHASPVQPAVAGPAGEN